MEELYRQVGRPTAVVQRGKYSEFIFDDEVDLVAFKAEAASLGISDPLVRMEHIYTRRELLDSPLLRLLIKTSEKGYGGPYYGTTFDLSHACPRCGSGAIQTSPLVLKRSETPSRGDIFQTMDYEFLVSPALAHALKEARIKGLELRQAVAHKDHVPLPWYQIISSTELPRMSDLTRGVIRSESLPRCPTCGRDGHFDAAFEPQEIVYDRSSVDIDALPDAVHTHERFGSGCLREPFQKSHIPNPLLLVKPKVFEIFEKQNVRHVEFVPVNIAER
jgi:hypothetical protein